MKNGNKPDNNGLTTTHQATRGTTTASSVADILQWIPLPSTTMCPVVEIHQDEQTKQIYIQCAELITSLKALGLCNNSENQNQT